MPKPKKKKGSVGPIYAFAFTWLALSFIMPVYESWYLIAAAVGCSLVALLVGRMIASKREKERLEEEKKLEAEAAERAKAQKKSYGAEVDAILEDGYRALSEMGRLYMSIKDDEVRKKINELMRVTDKIAQDAIADPSDVPQIKKFMNYYLPTTIKLLNAYDRMSAQGIEGDNLDKSMKSINDMLDAAIEAYKKRLDSLFANQALDIETDIEVMNTMLAREGLSGGKDFSINK